VYFQKSKSNQIAVANLLFQGEVIAKDVPVDELLGLESRLKALRVVLDAMPTLQAGQEWVKNINDTLVHSWVSATPEVTTKTKKLTTPVVLYEATDKHPAQVKEVSEDKVVGTFTNTKVSGCATSAQKAQILANVDELIMQAKQARMRANMVDADKSKIGETLVRILLEPLKD
jgi:hypothetical protein